MKVLFVSNYLYLDGPPIALYRLIKEFKKNNSFEISVLSFLDGPLRKWYEKLGINPIVGNYYDPTVGNIKALVTLIKKEKPDLVFANMMDTVNVILAANICKVPSIFYVHEDWAAINLSTYHLFAFKMADLVVFPSSYLRKVYAPILANVPTKVINNGLDFDEFSPSFTNKSPEEMKARLNLPLGKKIVSLVGIVCERKRQDLFVVVACDILKTRDDLVFLIIGRFSEQDPFYARLKKLVETAGLSEKILFVGEHEDPRQFYHISDLIVCPSSNDVTPYAILEALAFGKPVIATSIDGIPEILGNSQAGLLIKPLDRDDLGKALVHVIDHYGQYKNGASQLAKSMSKKFSIQKTANVFSNQIINLKLRKKKYAVKLVKGQQINFIAKRDTIISLKKLVPTVQRKSTSAFR